VSRKFTSEARHLFNMSCERALFFSPFPFHIKSPFSRKLFFTGTIMIYRVRAYAGRLMSFHRTEHSKCAMIMLKGSWRIFTRVLRTLQWCFRGAKTYIGRRKKIKEKTETRGCDVTLQIRRGAIKVWIQNLLPRYSKNYPRTPTNFSNLLCSSPRKPCKNLLTRLLARLRRGKRNFRGKDSRVSYPGISIS